MSVHVTVSMDGESFTAFPNVAEIDGSYLFFQYSDDAPRGIEDGAVFRLDNVTGPSTGGTEVTLENIESHTSTRMTDANFLPGSNLKCKFGSKAVAAEWTNYGKIMCVSPPFDPDDDEDGNAGGTQVTVYVANDATNWVDGNVTFTYYDGTNGGGYVEDPPDSADNTLDDLITSGNFTGDGRYSFEVEIDSAGSPDTFKWRLGSEGIYTTSVAVSTVETELTEGVSVRFGSTAGHAVGDAWSFEVGSGRPNITEVTTSGNLPEYPNRVPFEGNTELTLRGNNFLPSDQIVCRLSDSLTGVTFELPGHYDTPELMRCVAPRQDGHPGDGSLPGGRQYTTQLPCFYKDVQVSNDGGLSYSAVSASAQVFYCDLYVSPSGSDFAGTGTPDKPFMSIQRAIDNALADPRAYYIYKNEELTGVEHRGRSRRGFAHYINRDRVVLLSATYTGFGNIGLAANGKMVELVAEEFAQASLHCASTGIQHVLQSGDRNARESIINTGVLSLLGVETVGCGDTSAYYV